MEKVLVLGAGQFGRRAAQVLQDDYREVTIVDQNTCALEQVHASTIAIQADAIEYLIHNLHQYQWIVPAIPVHVALLWLLSELDKSGQSPQRIAVPKDIMVPNPFWLHDTLYASLARHLCPEDCPEPDGFCTMTGEERKMPLHRILAELVVPGFDVYVLQSHQLAPGVGGLLVCELQQLMIASTASGQHNLLATSCGCHAVIDAFTRK